MGVLDMDTRWHHGMAIVKADPPDHLAHTVDRYEHLVLRALDAVYWKIYLELE